MTGCVSRLCGCTTCMYTPPSPAEAGCGDVYLSTSITSRFFCRARGIQSQNVSNQQGRLMDPESRLRSPCQLAYRSRQTLKKPSAGLWKRWTARSASGGATVGGGHDEWTNTATTNITMLDGGNDLVWLNAILVLHGQSTWTVCMDDGSDETLLNLGTLAHATVSLPHPLLVAPDHVDRVVVLDHLTMAGQTRDSPWVHVDIISDTASSIQEPPPPSSSSLQELRALPDSILLLFPTQKDTLEWYALLKSFTTRRTVPSTSTMTTPSRISSSLVIDIQDVQDLVLAGVSIDDRPPSRASSNASGEPVKPTPTSIKGGLLQSLQAGFGSTFRGLLDEDSSQTNGSVSTADKTHDYLFWTV